MVLLLEVTHLFTFDLQYPNIPSISGFYPEPGNTPKRVKNAAPGGVVGLGVGVSDHRLTTPSPPIIPPTPILGVKNDPF